MARLMVVMVERMRLWIALRNAILDSGESAALSLTDHVAPRR